MKRNLARNVNESNKKVNAEVRSDFASASDVGNNLLKDDLTLENIIELAKRIAEQNEYDADQLVICEAARLNERLELHRNDNVDEKPIFVLCPCDDTLAVFCLAKLSNTIFCLYTNFLDSRVPDNIKDMVETYFGKNVEFKAHEEQTEKVLDTRSQDVLCLKTMETMMINLRPDKREDFIEHFDSSKKSFFQWLKNGVNNLKNELFHLVKDGYNKTITSDIDQLSRDTEFKEALKKLIDSIPLLDELENFKRYQRLLKEFVEMEENEVSDDISGKIKELEEAREVAFGKIENILKLDMSKNKDGIMELDIVKNFPIQMEKFTKIFEPLVRSKVDEKLDEKLKEISSKLDLEYDKLKVFFENKEDTKMEEQATTVSISSIEEIISALPECKSKDIEDPTSGNKTFEQLLSEMTTTEKSYAVDVKQLKEAYLKVKERYKLWSAKSALQINQWAISKKGELADSEVYEALAAMDRANELVTGCQKLRDTQILSVLTFLQQQRDKGQLAQIQTGEGKTTIVSMLAAIKALQGRKVDVVTSNPVLASDGVKDRRLFYQLLNLSAATNNSDENYKSGARECYRADVVYGSIGNFQFDHLRDSFLGLNTRADRPFDVIVLDEVDSMIIDNASHIAKLSGSLPGMESLKYVYIKIWQALYKAEAAIVQELRDQLKTKALQLQELPDSEEADRSYYQYQNNLQSSIHERMKNYIRSREPTKIDIIPSHIREYADKSLDKWIDNAIDARYTYNEDEQYVIRSRNGEEVVQPVDYANTGVTLKNTIWQHGLHQFLQLKHNLHLTAESLTSCFISNLGYINRYENNIFGLTGTLGSKAEQELLSSIYNLAYAKIPTYKDKRFAEVSGMIVDDEMFNVQVAYDAVCRVDEGRAALVICETIKDAKAIEGLLLGENITIRTFLDEESAYVTEEEVGPAEAVIATNIAGRGTDFRTTSRLESNGGLHVCVAFLPCNKRVEDQAFGRTARQGNRGTAKLIVKRSEIERLGIDDDDDDCSFEELKRLRDLRESDRIREIKEIKIPELEFQDRLFALFCALYRRLQARYEGKGEYKYVLDDLKEFWAFWLEKQSFEGSELADKSPEAEFAKFELEARETIVEGRISFNPYYSVLQAEHFIAVNEQLDRAERCLHRAIAISENPEILHSAYVKLFEIAIDKGGVFVDKCKAAVGDVFLIPAATPDREYKRNAKKYLQLAQQALKKEVDYIDSLLKDREFGNILVASASGEQVEEETTLDEQSETAENRVSTQQFLDPVMSNDSELIEQVDPVAVAGCGSDDVSNLKPESEDEDSNSELLEVTSDSSEELEDEFETDEFETDESETDEFETAENLFLKHIVSRQQTLYLNMSHATSLAKQIDEFGGGITVVARVPDYFSKPESANVKPKTDCVEQFVNAVSSSIQTVKKNTFIKYMFSMQPTSHVGQVMSIDSSTVESENAKKINEVITSCELAEMAAVGGNNVYALRQMHDVCPEIARAARIQIGGGMAVWASGVCFPPALPATAAIGNTMITEGLCDVAIELIIQSNDGKFQKGAYIKGKVISYGMALLTMGINAALQCPKIMNAAKRACRWMSGRLRDCGYLKWLCESFATRFDKLGEWFARMETLALFNQLSNADKLKYFKKLEKSGNLEKINHLGVNNLKLINSLQAQQRAGRLTDLTHFQKCIVTFQQSVVSIATNVTMRTVTTVVMVKVVTPLLSSAMSDLKPLIKRHVGKAVRENIDEEKFRHNSYEDIQTAIGEIKDSIDCETLRDIFQDCILGMAKHCSDWRIQLAALATDQLVSWYKVYDYAVSLCVKLNAKLKTSSESVNDKVDELVSKLIDVLTEQMYALLVSTTAKTFKEVYTVVRSAMANRKREREEEAKCREFNQRFKDGGPAGQEQAKATCDVIKRPIHIYGKDGKLLLVIGKQYSSEPVKLTYYPPDENNATGHYVPYGESENWSDSDESNDCFFKAVGSEAGRDPDELRQATIEQMDSDPRRYTAYHAREMFDDESEIFFEGGKRMKKKDDEVQWRDGRRFKRPIEGQFYPSFKNRIRVARDRKFKQVLADMRNRLNEHKKASDQFDAKSETEKLRFMRCNEMEPRCSSKPGKTDMMMGAMEVRFKNGAKPYTRAAVSGDCSFNFKGKIGDFEIIDAGMPEGKVYDGFNRESTDVEYNRSCSAQKLFHDFAEYMRANPDLEIDGDIYLAESWYEPGTATFKPESVIIEESCSGCEHVLPFATGKGHQEDFC